tara:strand:+ start:576 stop:896 length:321 start_codon:yes stop_codon:yes gene_type:complete
MKEGLSISAQQIAENIVYDYYMTHRYQRPISVRCENEKPIEFTHPKEGIWITINDIIDSWIIDTKWWTPNDTIKRHYFTVVTSWNGVYEMYHDGNRNQWFLSGDLD